VTQLVLAAKVVALVFAALASITNPPASVPIFLASTANCSSQTGINIVAMIAAMVTGVALIALSIYLC
jgi:small neutral amino acid transporter SnatA (MarC family)